MTPAEIKHHARAFAKWRSNQSLAAKRKFERGFHTPLDHNAGNRRVYGASSAHVGDHHAVDQAFEVHARTGHIPRGSWS